MKKLHILLRFMFFDILYAGYYIKYNNNWIFAGQKLEEKFLIEFLYLFSFILILSNLLLFTLLVIISDKHIYIEKVEQKVLEKISKYKSCLSVHWPVNTYFIGSCNIVAIITTLA